MTTEIAEPIVAVQDQPEGPGLPDWVTRWPSWMPPERLLRLGVLAVIVGLAFAFYCWTVNTSGSPIVLGQPQNDYYNQLADSFLHGQLSLLTNPPAALVHLKDPYDPAQNSVLAGPYHDLALYHGRFYLTWGPTAALVLFIPWRVLGLGDLSQSLSIVIFSAVGLIFALLLLCYLLTTYLPRVRLWKLAVAAVALATSSVEPFLMRRPAQYEVCISCAYCFLWAALYCMVSGCFGRWRPVRLAVGSLCLGLAILSREDLILLVVLPAGFFVREWLRRGRPLTWWHLWRPALVMLAPCAAVVLLLFAYNAARFGSPFQVGTEYQLASVDQQHAFVYQASSILPGLFYYFVAPVQYTLAFPYFLLGPPPIYPWVVANYAQTENVAGILTTTPVLAVLFVAPFVLRRRLARPLAWLLVAFALSGFAIALAIAFGIPGTTMRYEADFATLLLLPAIVCWFALSRGRGWHRRLLSGLGALLLLYGALVAVATSITGYYDEMRQFDTQQYDELAAATSFLPTMVTKLMGHPDITKDVYLCGNGECGTWAAGLSHWSFDGGNTVELDVLSPDPGWYLGVNVFSDPGHSGVPVEVQSGPRIWTYRTAKAERRIYVPLHYGYNAIMFTVPGKQPVNFYVLRTSTTTTETAWQASHDH